MTAIKREHSLTKGAMSSSAAHDVLNTNELVEAILTRLPSDGVTFRLARVNKAFHCNLLTRPHFQQALFVMADPDASPPRLLHIPLPGISIASAESSPNINITVSKVPLGKAASSNSLRMLLIRQPPLRVEVLESARVFHMKCPYTHTHPWGQGNGDLGDGVKVGHVIDIAQVMWKNGCKCASVTVVLQVPKEVGTV